MRYSEMTRIPQSSDASDASVQAACKYATLPYKPHAVIPTAGPVTRNDVGCHPSEGAAVHLLPPCTPLQPNRPDSSLQYQVPVNSCTCNAASFWLVLAVRVDLQGAMAGIELIFSLLSHSLAHGMAHTMAHGMHTSPSPARRWTSAGPRTPCCAPPANQVYVVPPLPTRSMLCSPWQPGLCCAPPAPRSSQLHVHLTRPSVALCVRHTVEHASDTDNTRAGQVYHTRTPTASPTFVPAFPEALRTALCADSCARLGTS